LLPTGSSKKQSGNKAIDAFAALEVKPDENKLDVQTD
jgi:hypothetical protein